MSLAILGIGTAVPDNRYTQDEAVEVARVVSCETEDQAKLLQVIYRQTHIAYRHIVFMGCHGAFNGMRVARAFAQSAPNARILLCATEICSIHYYYPWNPKRIVGNALFGDGAAALVGIPDKDAPDDAWRAVANGS